jgi:hypothetical protein
MREEIVPKWEYCRIAGLSMVPGGDEPDSEVPVSEIARPDFSDFPYLIYLRDIDEQELTSIDSASRTLAQLGLDGWELVSHTEAVLGWGGMFAIKHDYLLKREVE